MCNAVYVGSIIARETALLAVAGYHGRLCAENNAHDLSTLCRSMHTTLNISHLFKWLSMNVKKFPCHVICWIRNSRKAAPPVELRKTLMINGNEAVAVKFSFLVDSTNAPEIPNSHQSRVW